MTVEEVRRSLARRWNAVSHKPQWHLLLWLDFKVERAPAELTVSMETRHSPPWSEIWLKWAAPQNLRVAPEEFTTWMRRLFGSDDLKVGDAEFDRVFWIEASNEEWARKMLDEPIRARLLHLRSLAGGPNRLCLDVNRCGVRARVFRRLEEDEAALTALMETGLALLQKMGGPAPRGPEDFGMLRVSPGICPVCSSPATAKLVCPGCRTPHHAECWRYSGGCGIFACPGRRRPRRAGLRTQD